MNQPMSSSRMLGITLLLGIAAAAVVACGGPAAPAAVPTPAATDAPGATSTAAAPGKGAGPAAIPHGLEGKEDCTSCHKLGAKGPTGMPEDHKDRANGACTGCHQPKAK